MWYVVWFGLLAAVAVANFCLPNCLLILILRLYVLALLGYLCSCHYHSILPYLSLAACCVLRVVYGVPIPWYLAAA
jgi:hypothetical protein